MSDINYLFPRIHELRTISQVTGEYDSDAQLLDDYGALIVDVELGESDLTIDQLLDLNVGNTVRFGGGAAPLMELKRIV